jgi:hypothetical protein
MPWCEIAGLFAHAVRCAAEVPNVVAAVAGHANLQSLIPDSDLQFHVINPSPCLT